MPQFEISAESYDQMVAHCLQEYPLEGCGLLAAAAGGGVVTRCYPIDNAAKSARVYTLDPKEMLRVDRDAEDRGLEIVAVYHSHTHTAAYPSPTDVASAPLAEWHYVLVSFQEPEPAVRSFRIENGNITEEELVRASS